MWISASNHIYKGKMAFVYLDLDLVSKFFTFKYDNNCSENVYQTSELFDELVKQEFLKC